MAERIPKRHYEEMLGTMTTHERKHIKQLIPGYKYTYSSMREHVSRLKIGVQGKFHRALFKVLRHRIGK